MMYSNLCLSFRETVSLKYEKVDTPSQIRIHFDQLFFIFVTVHYSTEQYSTVQYSTVQYSTVQYSSVQFSSVQFSTVKCSAVQCSAVLYRLTLPHEHEQLSMIFKDPVLLGFIRIKNSDKNESSDISRGGARRW